MKTSFFVGWELASDLKMALNPKCCVQRPIVPFVIHATFSQWHFLCYFLSLYFTHLGFTDQRFLYWLVLIVLVH